MSYLLRVLVPDRPGMLGAVASALGGVGADIISVDVVERSAGVAVDDLVVELPPDKLTDSLVTAAFINQRTPADGSSVSSTSNTRSRPPGSSPNRTSRSLTIDPV